MAATEKTVITIETTVDAPVGKTWKLFTSPEHITQWSFASNDWHAPSAENDLRPGGKFKTRMEARDGSFGFDFEGVYTNVDEYKRLDYALSDERKISVTFEGHNGQTKVTETFDAENENSAEMQRTGWQAILDNFKKYAEASPKMIKLHYEINIDAPAEKVFVTMIDPKTYMEWTAEFNPTSHFKGSWEKGSGIRFLGTDNDGNIGGMVSRIQENIPNRFISIEHLGMIEKGKEITSGPAIDSWLGALENYSFTDTNGRTLLSVDTDSNEELKDYFSATWPKALKKLKEICER